MARRVIPFARSLRAICSWLRVIWVTTWRLLGQCNEALVARVGEMLEYASGFGCLPDDVISIIRAGS